MSNKKKFYNDCDDFFKTIIKFLDTFPNSSFLKNYFSEFFETFVYGNLINNFFNNLTRENIKELNLPKGKIKLINVKYKQIREKSKFLLNKKLVKIDRVFYEKFKTKLSRDFPEFKKISVQIENIIDYNKLKKYVDVKKRKIKNLNKKKVNLSTILNTALLKSILKKKRTFPNVKELQKTSKPLLVKFLDLYSKEVKLTLDKSATNMLNGQRTVKENRRNEG